MPSYRCALCGINFPLESRFRDKCELHDTVRSWQSDDPDEDWERRFLVLQERIVKSGFAEDPVPEVFGDVRFSHGQYWVSSWDVIDAGLRRLQSLDVIQVEGELYEILFYADDFRAYAVRKLELPDTCCPEEWRNG